MNVGTEYLINVTLSRCRSRPSSFGKARKIAASISCDTLTEGPDAFVVDPVDSLVTMRTCLGST
jgi:hypothetical protein